MGDSFFGGINSDLGKLKNKRRISYCAVCDTRLPPNAIFCLECDPPLPPGAEPEETGISFDQALIRIGILVTLFLAVAIVKLDISFDQLFLGKQTKNELETLAINKQPQDKDFQTIHTITASLVNIRSMPSKNGKIILIAERGMNLQMIEGKKNWSKVRVLEKSGWISNKLFKTEVVVPQ